MFAMDHAGARSVLMTSPDVDQGTTWAAANLAVALAATGRQVVLVSADLRRPCLGTVFGVEPRATLADVLTQAADLQDALRLTAIDGLWIVEGQSLTGHCDPTVAADLADSSTARRLVREMATDFADVVLVCAPPLTAHADTINWAPACDAVVLVSDVRTTTHRHVAAAREQLERAHATVVGAVVIERGRWTWRLRSALSGGRSKAPAQLVRTSHDARISQRANGPDSAARPGET
jgi:capsular exopolysaccharide synthesis family protein